MRIPRAACINDLSGFGRCSLTTAISIISAAGVQACPVPTAVLSKHTQFPDFYFHDLTETMPPYLESWKNVEFDGIYSGFLGSSDQIDITQGFIASYREKNPDVNVIIDPVMGDKGKLYATYTDEMCRRIRGLVSHSDIITPNITEACFLTETEYSGEEISIESAKELLKKLFEISGGSVVLTGVEKTDSMVNIIYDGNDFVSCDIPREKRYFSGTGDIFASVVCAMVLKGKSLSEAVGTAGKFISSALKYTVDSGAPLTEGVIFEPLLCTLGERTEK